MKIFQRVQEIWSGQESVTEGHMNGQMDRHEAISIIPYRLRNRRLTSLFHYLLMCLEANSVNHSVTFDIGVQCLHMLVCPSNKYEYVYDIVGYAISDLRSSVIRVMHGCSIKGTFFNLALLNTDMPCLCKQCRSRSDGF